MLFVVGTAVLGIVSAAVVLAHPDLWLPILLADLWLLGYPHVVSTYTRLAMDPESRRANRALITWLPILMLATVAAVWYGLGAWALATTYFYWQWWHYTRQSWGVSRVYERKAGLDRPVENPRVAQAVFYLFPAWGILWRSAQGWDEFLGLDFKTVPVPPAAAHAVGAVACAGVGWLVVQRARAWRQGRLPLMHTLYLASHYTIFAFGYLLIDNINVGWLAINVWHNAQYILFVWYYNNQRYESGIDQDARALSWISQPRRVAFYMGLVLAVSSVVYLVLQETVALVITPIVIYQAINFHHYVVDSLIWKVRKKPMQQTLGLESASGA